MIAGWGYWSECAAPSPFVRNAPSNNPVVKMGSYVPAESAEMYCLDGVYTRMGAGDDLAADMSTFMVTFVLVLRVDPKTVASC